MIGVSLSIDGLREPGPPSRVRDVRLVGATGFEPATFRPPAGKQIVSMRPPASTTSNASTVLDNLDALDVAVGTTGVPREASGRQTLQVVGGRHGSSWCASQTSSGSSARTCS